MTFEKSAPESVEAVEGTKVDRRKLSQGDPGVGIISEGISRHENISGSRGYEHQLVTFSEIMRQESESVKGFGGH
ncbi:hypothetical protein LTR66_000977 [Elasticomyces elasticus]|nr:hypothetical protein LTR66_000977 [Elasticomyces elasticus]